MGPTLYCSEVDEELTCWSIGILVIMTWQSRFELIIMVSSGIFEHALNEVMAVLSG